MRYRTWLVMVGIALAAPDAFAATFVVTRGDDPAPDGCLAGDCSLREALDAAVSTPSADVVALDAGQYTVSRGALPVIGDVAITGHAADATRIVGIGSFALIEVAPLATLAIDGVQLASQASAIESDAGAVTLRNVRIPAGGGTVSGSSEHGAVNLAVEHSELGDAIGCECGSGSLHASDSTLNAVLVFNGSADLVLDRVDVVGPAGFYAIAFTSSGTATVRDSTISHHASPLVLDGAGGDVTFERTRFFANTGPLSSSRSGSVRMTDVEFRDNVVDDQHATYPAVLLATAGTGWRIARALFAGNRGGGGGSGQNLIGSTVRVLSGGNVVISNSTFHDNTFRSGIDGLGHAIGVDVSDSAATVLWLFHVTMHTGPFVAADAPASLLVARGSAANIRIYNSVMRGTCAFASSATMFQAEGNLEAPGHSCRFPAASNDNDMPLADLLLGPLADNGGFTQTLLPTRFSPAIDRGIATWCNIASFATGSFAPLDQRRYQRPPDGTDCDSGATETDALSDTIFADGFD